MNKTEDHWIIKALEWCSKQNKFNREQFADDTGLDMDYINRMVRIGVIKRYQERDGSNTPNDYEITAEGLSFYIQHTALQEARDASKNAHRNSIIAIVIAGVLTFISILSSTIIAIQTTD